MITDRKQIAQTLKAGKRKQDEPVQTETVLTKVRRGSPLDNVESLHVRIKEMLCAAESVQNVDKVRCC
jgi:hypothetical protein